MKIDTTIKNVTATRGKDSKPGQTKSATAAAAAASLSADVRLTDTSAKLRELEAELTEVGVTDGGKIESVRQAIADGSFTVDEEVVADGLIQESIENISHQAPR